MYKLNKIIIGMFITFILFSSNIFAYTNVKNFNPKYGTLTARTNFRTKPSTSSSVISVLAKGTNVKMVGESNNFYIVQLSNNQIGYVSKDYVKSSTVAPKGASTYTNLSAKIGKITGNSVNLRRGPGTNFAKITKLTQNTEVKVIGSISDFYTVITLDNTVGMIHKDYINLTNTSSPASNTTNRNTRKSR